MKEKPRILLIDDDADVHLAVKMILEPLGYVVQCCLTGQQGLEAARKELPDLLLLDVMLATPSEGFHVAYDFKMDERLRDVPIVMVSAISEAMGIDFAREVGTPFLPAERFVNKPFDAKTLREAVEATLHGVKSAS